MGSVGSPPERVTPPPEVSKNGLKRTTFSTMSSTLIRWPTRVSAFDGQTSTHSKQSVQIFRSMKSGLSREIAPWGHALMHSLSSTHFSWSHHNSGVIFLLSGLWHQRHLRGQPLEKTTDRIPGPSSTELPSISMISGDFVSFKFEIGSYQGSPAADHVASECSNRYIRRRAL